MTEMPAWTPPHSIEAEQAVIGGLLIDTDAMMRVADVVRPEDFFGRQNRLIYDAALKLESGGQRVDLLTVIDALGKDLDEAGGREYLGRLARDTPSAANVRSYAEVVRNRSVERQLIQAGMQFKAIVDAEGTPSQKLDRAQQAVLDIGRETAGGPQALKAAMPQWVDEMETRHNRGGGLVGLSTGLTDLDSMTGGLRQGDLVVVAGRPSMGKTALAMQMAAGVAEGDQTALVFSMEMPTTQLIDRLVSSEARVPMQQVRSGQLENEQWREVTDQTSRISAWPLLVDESGTLTVTDLRARARRVKRQQGLGLVVVDYLQLMEGKGENRTGEISEISRGLKRLAKELEVPVIALSQLNRSLESRLDKRPRMSDLRESGAIEQDADMILFVYRDEVYHDNSLDEGTAELILSKQRNGATGKVRTAFLGQFTRFQDLDWEAYQRSVELKRMEQRQARKDNGMADL